VPRRERSLSELDGSTSRKLTRREKGGWGDFEGGERSVAKINRVGEFINIS